MKKSARKKTSRANFSYYRGNLKLIRGLLLLAIIIVSTIMPLAYGFEDKVKKITNTGNIRNLNDSSIGVTYLSLHHLYSPKYTPEPVLKRDFLKFQQDGITMISLSLYWYRLEGDIKGSYNGVNYGDSFLDNVKRVISIASQYNITVLINFNTLWGNDSLWCTPKYVLDPVTNLNDGLAIVRSTEMREAFIDMFNHTIKYLAGTPGICGWAILNEPWYWGTDSYEHDFITENGNTQKENFISLMQQLSIIVDQYDRRPVTIKFVSFHEFTGINGAKQLKNIFIDDWGWDERILNVLDFISFNNYLPSSPDLEKSWQEITSYNVLEASYRNKEVWITEFGSKKDDDEAQALDYYKNIQLYKSLPIKTISAWYWESDNNSPTTFGYGGAGMNLCKDSTTADARSSYHQLINFKTYL